MSFSNAAETEILNYIFKDAAVSWDGQASLYLSLHTSDPGEAGTAVTNESAYTSYARVVLTRATDITTSGNQITNANLEQFPTCTGGSETITHACIVSSASGAGVLIAKCALTSSLSVSNGIQPQFAAESLTFTLD
jgi:hypothetical protein